MSAPACNIRFVENETQTEVQVESVFSWFDEHERIHIVTYPTGRRYAMRDEDLNLHFTIVTPQEVVIRAWGNMGDDRPTPKQVALEQAQESAKQVDMMREFALGPGEAG
jgi:hypothetical protein